MKKLKSQFTAEVEAQIPVGVKISFREEPSVNPSEFLVLSCTSLFSPANAEAMIQQLLDSLQAALDE